MAMGTGLNPRVLASRDERSPVQWGKVWALSFGIGTVVALSAILVGYICLPLAGRHVPILRITVTTLPDWAFWALAAPPAFYLARRLPIGGHRRWWHLAAHIAIGLVVAALQLISYTWAVRSMVGLLGFPDYAHLLFFTATNFFHYQVLIYWIIILGTHAYEFYVRYRERQLQSARLETNLIRAQLQALRSQIQPHFLFNSLHNIAMLMREKRVDEAADMIARLGDLMRKTLDGDGSQEVPLSAELQLALDYLAIEQVRFGDRMRIRVKVEEDARDALVPAMLLQPLVENAVRHGISRRAEAGSIEIDARVEGVTLMISVSDDGPGLGATPDDSTTRLGLANTRQRLEHMYGVDDLLQVADAEGGGATVTVKIPLRHSDAAGELQQ